MAFTPTNYMGSKLVMRTTDAAGHSQYYDAAGKRVPFGVGRKVMPLPDDFVWEPEPELPEVDTNLDMPQTVRLHADAVCALIKAAVWPEWGCATGFAQSPRGDSATCNPNERGPNGEKVVRICTVSPGRVSAAYEILVPQFMTFEIHKKV